MSDDRTEAGLKQSQSGGSLDKADPFQQLLRDHDRIRDLLKEIQLSTKSQVAVRQELFSRLEKEVQIHMEAEERFFYTALEQHDTARSRVLEGYEEHLVARSLLGTFNSLAVDDERWPAKQKVLRQLVTEHMEAEERELFALARQVLAEQQLEGIAAKIQEVKKEPKKPEGQPDAR
jgi:hemerythrin-like domain-containing protein